MHYLITGGTGFVGNALVTSLLGDGHPVTVLTRSIARTRGRLPPGAQAVEALDDAAGVDAVVNLAGEPLADGRWTPRRKQAFRDSRIGTTQGLVRWIAGQDRKPAVLVSGSAIGYYGPHGDEELDEDAAPGTDLPAQLCREWEAAAVAAEASGIRVCRIRIGVVLDRDGGALAKMLPPFRLGLGGRMGSGRQWMSWVHREDLVALIRWLVERETLGGAWNATAPHPVTNAEFARQLGHALHRPALMPTPTLLLRAMFGEMAELMLTGQKVLPARALARGFRFRFPQVESALAASIQRPES